VVVPLLRLRYTSQPMTPAAINGQGQPP